MLGRRSFWGVRVAFAVVRSVYSITEGRRPPLRLAGPLRWRCADFTRPCQV
jgi:hypothetical protein